MFDPSTLAGKILWIRAKDLGVDASSVSTWPDQSGLAHDALMTKAAPTVAANSTPVGGKSVRFAGSASLWFYNYHAIPITAALASTEYSAQYAAANSIDGLPETSGYNNVWASSTLPAWLRLQPTTATAVSSYAIVPRVGPSVNQSPKDWTFEGSNDGTTWTVLDTRTGEVFTAGQTKQYSFTNSTTYTYYRINITAVNGSTLAAIAEIGLNPPANFGVANNPIDATVSAVEIWAVIKADAASPMGLWAWGQDTGGADESHYPYSDGKIYEATGLTSGNRRSFTPSETLTQWQIYRVRNDGTTWEAWMSGRTQLSASGLPFGYTSTQSIGQGRINGGFDQFFKGNIAEILVRSQISTPTEESNIYNYLVTEHINTGSTNRLLDEVYVDALTAPTSTPRNLNELYIEATTIPTVTPRYLNELYVEVLTPSALTAQFKGWGTPL